VEAFEQLRSNPANVQSPEVRKALLDLDPLQDGVRLTLTSCMLVPDLSQQTIQGVAFQLAGAPAFFWPSK
jgi:hypothetical protein